MTVDVKCAPGRGEPSRFWQDKRAGNAEARVVGAVPGLVPVAVGRAEVVWVVVRRAESAPSARRAATQDTGPFRLQVGIEAPALEDRMAQAPSVCLLRVGDPGADPGIDNLARDLARAPAGAQAAAEAVDVVVGQATPTVMDWRAGDDCGGRVCS
jgi:hypothetical protein